MFLHLGDIVASLVKGQHLPLVKNHRADMELLKRLFNVGSIVWIAVLHHEELPELLVQGHARDIQAGQLLIGHVFAQVVEFINLGGIEHWLDERATGGGETVSSLEERFLSIPFEQEKDGQQGQDEQECPFEMR